MSLESLKKFKIAWIATHIYPIFNVAKDNWNWGEKMPPLFFKSFQDSFLITKQFPPINNFTNKLVNLNDYDLIIL